MEKRQVKELWKIVVRNKNYEVSSLGRVRRITPEQGIRAGKIRKLGYNGKYFQVSFPGLDGKWRPVGVHQLVAEAFIGPCPPGKEVNHKDLNKRNNRYTNLEYKTHVANCRHAMIHGHWPVGEKNGRAKLTRKDVVRIWKLHHQGMPKIAIARLFPVNRSSIQFILKGKTWK
jgi:hypothetical protein